MHFQIFICVVFLGVWALVPQKSLAGVGSLSTSGSPGWQASALPARIILPPQEHLASRKLRAF